MISSPEGHISSDLNHSRVVSTAVAQLGAVSKCEALACLCGGCGGIAHGCGYVQECSRLAAGAHLGEVSVHCRVCSIGGGVGWLGRHTLAVGRVGAYVKGREGKGEGTIEHSAVVGGCIGQQGAVGVQLVSWPALSVLDNVDGVKSTGHAASATESVTFAVAAASVLVKGHVNIGGISTVDTDLAITPKDGVSEPCGRIEGADEG